MQYSRKATLPLLIALASISLHPGDWVRLPIFSSSDTLLAKHAGIARQSVVSAERGDPIRPETAKAIADALSTVYKREIKPLDIDGLNIV